jgi:hypothetical protein
MSLSTEANRVNAKRHRIYYSNDGGVTWKHLATTNRLRFGEINHPEVAYGVAGSQTAVRFSGVEEPFVEMDCLYTGRMTLNGFLSSPGGFSEAITPTLGEYPEKDWKVETDDVTGLKEVKKFKAKIQSIIPYDTIEGGATLLTIRLEITSDITRSTS